MFWVFLRSSRVWYLFIRVSMCIFHISVANTRWTICWISGNFQTPFVLGIAPEVENVFLSKQWVLEERLVLTYAGMVTGGNSRHREDWVPERAFCFGTVHRIDRPCAWPETPAAAPVPPPVGCCAVHALSVSPKDISILTWSRGSVIVIWQGKVWIWR